MNMYLVQHGEPLTKEENPERPLSEVGRTNVELVARAAAALGIRVDCIYHSEKLRSLQTAERFGEYLKAPIQFQPGLVGTEPVRPCYRWLTNLDHESVMVVGHLPLLGKITSLLVSGSADDQIVAFRNAGVVNIDDDQLQWILWPEHCGLE